MSDIIVSFDDSQGGFGDILFAAKLAHEIKQKLKSIGILAGNVYMVANGSNRFCNKLEVSRADVEFGINFLTNVNADELLKQNVINPVVIIEAPTPATIPFQHKSAMIISAREYSIGPFKTIAIGDSFSKATPEIKLQYESLIKTEEESRITKYLGNTQKEIIRTGLIEGLNERGIILSEELVDLTWKKEAELAKARELHLASLPNKMKSLLLQGKDDLKGYDQESELTFAYSHKSNTEFIKIHSGWIKTSDKNQDVFLCSPEEGSKVKNSLEQLKDSLISQGFAKISYLDYDTGEEKILYDTGDKGKSYRLIHSNKGIPHQQVVALEAISGPLTLASGDQSFGEAISADKIICYETFEHKELLYSAYEDRAKSLSPTTQNQLALLRLEPHKQDIKKKQDFAKLGEELRANNQLRDEISTINKGIMVNSSLAETFVTKLSPAISALDQIEEAIINQKQIEHLLPSIEYPKHFFLAIRYGNNVAMQQMLKQNPNCLVQKDALGNNAFIVATQEKQFGTLKWLLTQAEQAGIPFSQINAKNKHFVQYSLIDYLPPTIVNNKSLQQDIFGNYSSELARILESKMPAKVETKPVSVTSVGMFAAPKAAPVNIWVELSTKAMETNAHITDENELVQKMKPFLVVAREYLKNQPAFVDEFHEADTECNKLGIDENWAHQHVDQYIEMVKLVESFISTDAHLSKTIGVQWIPATPKNTLGTHFRTF